MRMDRIAAAPAASNIAAAPAVSSIAAAPAASSTVAAPASRRRIDWRAVALLLLGIAVLLRSGCYGNALFGEDEQFYLLVGDRMLHGARLYVDIWDRKPFGLFALFAAIRLLPGDGILAAQLVATAFAAATAFIVVRIAARGVSLVPAILAGVFYLLAIGSMGGEIYQTPVFYNLAIALAAWLVLDTAPGLDQRGNLTRAAGAMLLAGLAIQIKTNAVFEGAGIGLWLTARLLRHRPPGRVAMHVALFAMLGLLPTLAVGLGFVLVGHGDAWWFANVESQLLKQGGWATEALIRLAVMLAGAGTAIVLVAIGLARMPRGGDRTLLSVWTAATAIDAITLGNFWPHYALPFLLVASIVSAQVFALPRWGRHAFALVALYPALDAIVFHRMDTAQAQRIMSRNLAAIPTDVKTRCLLGYETPAIYYHLTHACLVTPYIFVDQLRSSAEAHALPEDSAASLQAALARRPGTILTVDGSQWKARNRRNDAILRQALARDYRAVRQLPYRGHDLRETTIVWRRRDLSPRDLSPSDG